MKNVFLSAKELDKSATNSFNMPPELLMENAASGMYYFLKNRFLDSKNVESLKVLLVCGSGDNGADCLALARMLCGICEVYVFLPKGAKSPLCAAQLQRLESLKAKANLRFQKTLKATDTFDIVLDGMFGAGFRGELDIESTKILQTLNKYSAVKIACDIPSGITQSGAIGGKTAFKADFTLTMGALKAALFMDLAKDFVGEVHCIDLGISNAVFTPNSPLKLLERSDFQAPRRIRKSINKGDFGHLCVYAGDKQGASILSALAGLRSGAGLVSVISKDRISNLPFCIMNAQKLPQNVTAILLGMGFGRDSTLDIKTLKNKTLLLDADIFYNSAFKELLSNKNIVLTPHPKEFTQILRTLNIADISTQELQNDRVSYALKFCETYPNAILVLKGANTIIAQKQEIYINPFGNNALAKGGSGDVLAGIIGGYLAQGYTPLDSAIFGVMLHSFCAESYVKKHNNFSLSPFDLIDEICNFQSKFDLR